MASSSNGAMEVEEATVVVRVIPDASLAEEALYCGAVLRSVLFIH